MKGFEQGRQQDLAAGRRDTDAKQSTLTSRHIRKRTAKCQFIALENTRVAIKYLAPIRQLERHMTDEELHPHLSLHRRDMPRKRPLRHMQSLRGPRKIPLFDERQKIGHGLKIHKRPPGDKSWNCLRMNCV